MHSRNKIRLYYPELGIETAQKQENDSYALWDFYGKATSPQLRDYDVSVTFYSVKMIELKEKVCYCMYRLNCEGLLSCFDTRLPSRFMSHGC